MQEKVKFFCSVTPYLLVRRLVKLYQSIPCSIFSSIAGRTSSIAYGTLYFVPYYLINMGYALAQLVEALCYKPEDRGFDSRFVTGIFH
jgi:hypothetical protein